MPLFKNKIFSTFLIAVVFVFLYQGANYLYIKKYLSPSNTSAYSGGGFVVDHTSVHLFEQIPPEYIRAAANLRMFFMDRSVGVNINEGITCLSYSSIDSAPDHCQRPSAEIAGFNPSSLYNRDKWVFQTWPVGTTEWEGNLQSFFNTINPPNTDNTILNNVDVVSYQYSYLAVNPESSIANPATGFFADTPGVKDVYDLDKFEKEHPSKNVIYWTSSLSRQTGSSVSERFNQRMRQYAIDNNKILLDVADIESHAPNGQPCYDNRDGVYYSNGNVSENHPNDGLNIPAICKEYTTEANGGHLGSYSAGKIRIAKAMWVLMARLAGWNPGGTSTPPSPTSQSSAQPLPTATSVSTPAPSATRSIHIGNLEGQTGDAVLGWRGNVLVIVHDENHQPVVNATVYGDFNGMGFNKAADCVTKTGGNCRLPSGVVGNLIQRITFSISDVEYSGSVYDISANHDIDADTSGINLTLEKP